MIDGGLRQLFRKHLPEVDWTPVETFSTGRGVPELHYCVDGVAVLIELKAVRGIEKVRMRPEQIAWCERYLRHGGRVWIAVRQGQNFFLFTGRQARELHLKFSLPAMKLTGGPARWDWTEIRDALAKRCFSFFT